MGFGFNMDHWSMINLNKHPKSSSILFDKHLRQSPFTCQIFQMSGIFVLVSVQLISPWITLILSPFELLRRNFRDIRSFKDLHVHDKLNIQVRNTISKSHRPDSAMYCGSLRTFLFPGRAGKGILQEMRHLSAQPVKLSSKNKY